MTRWTTAFLLATLAAPAADATPRPLTAAERAEITALTRRLVEALRDGARDPVELFPTVPELRAIFGVRATGDAGPDGGGMMVQRQIEALSRDARDLRARLAGAQFRGLAGAGYARGNVDPRRCGRYGAADSLCIDGPVVEYAVGNDVRRFRVDTLVRVGAHWRVLDLLP